MSNVIRLDFTNVKEITNLSAGKHILRVKKVESVTASTGSPMLTITFENAQGETGLDNFVLTESALWKLKNLMVALFKQNFTGAFDFDITSMIGKTCTAVAKEEEYVKQDGTPAIRTVLDNYMPVNEADTMGVTPSAPAQPTMAQPQVAPVTPVTPVTPVVPQAPVTPVTPVAQPGNFAQAEANPFPQQATVGVAPVGVAPVQPQVAPAQPTQAPQAPVAKRPWE